MTYQLVVFMENKPGRLSHVTEVLAGSQINIRAMTIASAGNFGLLKLVVDRPDQAFQLLKTRGFTVTLQEVLALVMKDEPGGLNSVLKILAEKGLNVKDACAFVEESGQKAVLILEVDDFSAAKRIVQEAGIPFHEESMAVRR